MKTRRRARAPLRHPWKQHKIARFILNDIVETNLVPYTYTVINYSPVAAGAYHQALVLKASSIIIPCLSRREILKQLYYI